MTSSGNSIAAGQLDAGHPTEQAFDQLELQLLPGAGSLFSDSGSEDDTSEFGDDDRGFANASEDEDDCSEDGEVESGHASREQQAPSSEEDHEEDSDDEAGSQAESESLYDSTEKKIVYDDEDVVRDPECTVEVATWFADNHSAWVDEYLSDNPELVHDHLGRNPELISVCLSSNPHLILNVLSDNPDSVCTYIKNLQSAPKFITVNHPQTLFVAQPATVTPNLSRDAERARAVDGDGTYPYSAYEISLSRVSKAPAGNIGWRKDEEDGAIRHMLDIRDEASIKGEARFKEASDRLIAEGINRSWGGVKNYWNRAGRKRSGFDERSKKTPELATSKQGKAAKEERKEREAERVEREEPKQTGRKRKAEEELDEAVVRAAQYGTRQH